MLQLRLAQTQTPPLAMMGTAEDPGVVLVVHLTPTSGMSILQTSQTSYLQKNYYRLVVYVFFLHACVDK